jgi:cob(I)alamin adenosyltransferase
MVRINRVYTRTGDKGETALVGGSRIAKDSARIEAVGDVDELNSLLGYCRTLAECPESACSFTTHFSRLQNELFDLGAYLASPPGTTQAGTQGMDETQVARLEQWIDTALEGLPELRSFVLPGGRALNCALHLARSVARRAERRMVALSRLEPLSASSLAYINRLSDLLFALARREAADNNAAEYLWTPKVQP